MFDIGWLGAVTSKRKIDDGKWHSIAATWNHKSHQVTLHIDGLVEGRGKLAAKAKRADAVVRIGYTAPDFPGPQSFFNGELRDVRFFQRALNAELKDAQVLRKTTEGLLADWNPAGAIGTVVKNNTAKGRDAQVVRGTEKPLPKGKLVAGYRTESGMKLHWSHQEGRLLLTIPAGSEPLRFTVWMKKVPDETELTTKTLEAPAISEATRDLSAVIKGGPPRWNQKLSTTVHTLFDQGPFATDVLIAPEGNPWLAQCRFTGLDFYSDGRLAVCSWDGDVWVVEGPPNSQQLTWKRIATGLYQPLGLKILNDTIYLTCRDQLAVLRDLNDDGETDFIECLNNDHQVTEHFHEFAMGLQTDAAGNFYYAKSGRHALEAVVPHHGTLLKVSRDGSKTEILANGFRAANGVCLNPDGSFVVTDQEGFWNPKNRINWVTLRDDGKPRFYGNMFGYHAVTDTSDTAMEPPLCWITNAFDRSPGELLWVDSKKWGPLNGSLLNLSYGYGKVFLVPHESLAGQMQGGMIELPIPAFPTGVMRGRFHPGDGQLYLAGMFAWAGSATHPGGLYRLRATGKPLFLPKQLHATRSGLRLLFTESLKSGSMDVSKIQVKTWDLKRSANYGSQHFNERTLSVKQATVSPDGTTLELTIPEIKPTWGMEIRYALPSPEGQLVEGVIHNTIHNLAPENKTDSALTP